MKPDQRPYKHWSTNILIDRLKGLHSAVYESECFGTRDILLYDIIAYELERRGYSIGFPLNITKI